MPNSSLGRLLIVDDEIELLNSLADKLAKQGYETVRFSSPQDALRALEDQTFELLLTDLMMPGMDGISLLRTARQLDPYLAAIVMTGQATVQTAVDALKLGALDYVLKPFTISVILPVLARALESRRLRLENIQLRETVGIYELCNAIAFTLDHQILLNKVADAAIQQCEAEEASIMLPTENGDELRVAVVRGEDRGHLLGERIPFDQGIAGWVAKHHEPITISGEVADPRFAPVHPRADIRCAISTPMIVGGRLVGVLNVNSTKRRYPFTMGQVKALNILANTGAAALENAQLHLAIRRAEENYRSIFENASEGILRSTREGRIQIANPALTRMLGYDSSDDLAASVHDLGTQVYRHLDDRDGIVRRLEEAGGVQNAEVEMVRKDGGRIWVTLNCRAIRDAQGKTVRYDSTFGDITHRKLAEKLSAVEHQVAKILAVAPSLSGAYSGVLKALGEQLEQDWCAVWRLDPYEEVLRCAEAWHQGDAEAIEFESHCRTLEIAPGSSLVGRVWGTRESIWVPNIAEERGSTRATSARRAGYSGALAFPLLVNGTILGVIELFSKELREPEPALLRTLCTIGDQIGQFVKRRRAEEERDRFFELSVDMLCVAGFDGVFQLVNPAWTATLGWTAEELTRRPYIEFVHPDDRGPTVAEAERLVATAGTTFSFENRYRCKDGSYRWISWRSVVDTTRRVIYASARDTTEKRQAEAELRLRDRAIQAVVQGILITDPNQPDNPIVYASPGFERLTGYAAAEVAGRNCRFLQGKDTDSEQVAKLRIAVRDETDCTVELLNYRSDGTSFWNEVSVSPVRDGNGVTHFVGVLTDVTARKRLEEQFRQAQKMQAIGKLAAGIAHDFNNLLTIINGYSEMLIQSLPPNDPSRELLTEIHHAGERSAGLTRQLLVFSRQQVLAPRILELNAVVLDSERLLRRMIGEDVRLTTALDPELGAIRADPGQVEQVLLNLAVNARDAMPTGGQLTIETRNVELGEDDIRSNADARPGPHILLAVSDTGCGMTSDVKARIFEPFFTTKSQGKGTGLGLATVYGIVQQSGGIVDVYSEVGTGTTFKVYLPWVQMGAESAGVRPRPLAPPRGTETILLVEDEDAVRTLTRHVLAGCGYKVLEASDGEAAVRIARSHHAGTIHLLITDVVMPGLGGRAVAESVEQQHPKVQILFVSGYTDDAVVRHGVLSESANFLQKPFSPIALAVKVREVLEARGNA